MEKLEDLISQRTATDQEMFYDLPHNFFSVDTCGHLITSTSADDTVALYDTETIKVVGDHNDPFYFVTCRDVGIHTTSNQSWQIKMFAFHSLVHRLTSFRLSKQA